MVKLFTQLLLLACISLEAQEHETPIDTTSNSTSSSEQNLTIEQRLKVIEEKLDRKELPKFTLAPNKQFQSFAFGTNFDLLDGATPNSLYGDILVNLGTFTENGRLSMQFGTVRGRNSNRKFDSDSTINIDELVVNNVTMDSSGRRIQYKTELSNTVSDEVLNVYGRLNYLAFDGKIKIFLSGQLEYVRIKSDVERITISSPVDSVNIPKESIRTNPRAFSISDTTKFEEVNSYFMPSFGVTLFSASDNFDFSYTIINGYRFAAFEGDSAIETGYGFIVQGSVLEKKSIGAKLGFELRYFPSDVSNEPSYFFYLAKQFSLEEFFKLFSPSSS